MNKQELVRKLSDLAHIKRGDAETIIDTLGTIVTEALVAGDDITLPGVGKLSVVQKAARTGRNPATGEEVKIAARRAPKFSAAKALKDALNAAKKGKK